MKTFRAAAVLLALFTVLTGVVYPLAVFAASSPWRAAQRGSLIVSAGKIVGSKLIGQPFSSPGYFWGRPSATTPDPFNAAGSSGSNLGPTSGDLAHAVALRVEAITAADPEATGPVPIDLVTASASGLDPHISPAAAYYQAHRVATARRLDEAEVKRLVASHVEGRELGVLGEPRVNVLALNLALDGLAGGARDP